MGRPKKWPSYALESAENTLALLQDFNRDLRLAQELIASGEDERAQLLIADARVASRLCIEHLLRALTGKYQREDVGVWPAQTIMEKTANYPTSGAKK